MLEWLNGYFYIGQSMNVTTRWSCHQAGFKTGHMAQHHPKLYNVWLKHGKPTFRLLEECPINRLDDVEQRYITQHWGNPLFCNTNPSSRNSRGAKRTKPPWNTGVPMTDEMKQRMSAIRKGLHAGENHPMVKLTDVQVMEIREKYVPFRITAQMLSNEYGVTKESILRILKNRTWVHLPSADIEKNKMLVASEGAIEFNGESRNLRQWAKHLGMDYLTLYQRVKIYKWPLNKAFNESSHGKGEKLTPDQVREIRAKYSKQKKGCGSTTLAKDYNVSYRTILYIVNGDRYANV